MNALTGEWLAKAEEDYSVASSLIRRKRIPANTVCFHSQQAAEKFLKGLLQENEVKFTRTHDLERLLDQAGRVCPNLLLLAENLKALTDYAVICRYPGFTATPVQAREAVQAAARVRSTVRAALGGRRRGK